MTLTPFLGISVIVHIVIIIGYNIAYLLPVRRSLPRKRLGWLSSPNADVYKSTAIIIVVFIVVVVNAMFLLWTSVHSEHSSIRIVRDLVSKTALGMPRDRQTLDTALNMTSM